MGTSTGRGRDERRRQTLRLLGRADSLVGGMISGTAAIAASMVAGGYPWRSLVPLLFSVVLLIIALVFGARAGIIGTLLAAGIFAAFLFQPLGRLRVLDEGARTNLGWMLLIGIGFSFLFAPPTSRLRRP